MSTPELAVALTLGITFSLLFAEFSGFIPGGLVVPGYLALYWNRPFILVFVIVSSIITYLVVNKLLGRMVILYGKRKFAAMLLIGMGLTLLGENLMSFWTVQQLSLSGVGVVVPGLIANCYQRQGFSKTFMSMGILVGATLIGLFLYSCVK